MRETIDETTRKPVTRICKIGAIDRLRARGSITEEQYSAAEKYALLYEAAEGARQDEQFDYIRADCSAVGRDGPTLAQMDALKELREVHQVLGKQATIIIQKVVIANCSTIIMSKDYKIDKKTVMGWLDAALMRLAEYWEFYSMLKSA